MEQIISGHSAGAASRYCRRLDCSFSLLRNRKLRKTKQKKNSHLSGWFEQKVTRANVFVWERRKSRKNPQRPHIQMSSVKQQQPPTRVCAVATRMDGRKGGRMCVCFGLLWNLTFFFFWCNAFRERKQSLCIVFRSRGFVEQRGG